MTLLFQTTYHALITSRKIVQCDAKCPSQLVHLQLVLSSQVARRQVAMDNSCCKGQFKLQFKLQWTLLHWTSFLLVYPNFKFVKSWANHKHKWFPCKHLYFLLQESFACTKKDFFIHCSRWTLHEVELILDGIEWMK